MQNKKEPYEKSVEMSRNVGYKTRNLLDFLYHKKYYKPIGIDKQIQAFLNKLILQES